MPTLPQATSYICAGHIRRTLPTRKLAFVKCMATHSSGSTNLLIPLNRIQLEKALRLITLGVDSTTQKRRFLQALTLTLPLGKSPLATDQRSFLKSQMLLTILAIIILCRTIYVNLVNLSPGRPIFGLTLSMKIAARKKLPILGHTFSTTCMRLLHRNAGVTRQLSNAIKS